jgi:hypothetical protein
MAPQNKTPSHTNIVPLWYFEHQIGTLVDVKECLVCETLLLNVVHISLFRGFEIFRQVIFCVHFLLYRHSSTSYNGSWSKRGCHVVSTTDTQTVCSCNHLTSFAVLMQLRPQKVTIKHIMQVDHTGTMFLPSARF